MKLFAQILSVVFHPLFIISYALMLLLCVNPYLFSIQETKQKVVIVISIVFLSVVFPLIAILMMRGLGFIRSIKMPNRSERILPLIATGIFYLWLYINLRNNTLIPPAFSTFVLGATISLFISFFINNFTKISLHAVGMGGLIAIVVLIRYFFSYESFYLNLGSLGNYQIHFNLLIIISILFAGLIGTSRLILSAHEAEDLWGGYIVGVLGQLISFRFLYDF